MNSFFINITKVLELKEGNETNANTVDNVLDTFNSHPSTERIKIIVKTDEKFSFHPVPEEVVHEIILNLDGSKATSVEDIPADILKSTVDIHLPF